MGDIPSISGQTMILGLLAAAFTAIGVCAVVYLVADRIGRMRLEKKSYRVSLPMLFRALLPLTSVFRGWVQHPSLVRTVNDADDKLVQAGMDQTLRAEDFVALRAVYLVAFSIAAIFFVLLGILMQMQLGTGQRPFVIFGVFLFIYGALYPIMWLRSVIKQRHTAIQRALPNVLDLLTLSVEAGRDFLTGLRDLLKHRERDPLGVELERVMRETQLGKPRRQALHDMAARVKQPDLTTVVETLAQADELGVSIGHILRILGEQMRQKRFQYAEKLANESPVKLMLPLFLFIFPAVLLVIFGPILLRWNLSAFL